MTEDPLCDLSKERLKMTVCECEWGWPNVVATFVVGLLVLVLIVMLAIVISLIKRDRREREERERERMIHMIQGSV